MPDFYQHRLVTTLHQLADPPFEQQQEQLKEFTKDKPITLVMPALYSEVEGPALPGILDHLEKVEFINEVVISMNRMDASQFKKAKEFFSRLPQKHYIIWNDGPEVSKVYDQLSDAQITDYIPGKGCNVWMAYGVIMARGNAGVIAMHDSDILSYDKEMLARLCLPTVHPGLEYDYCKSYYGRVSDRMYGRVTRLFVIPLLRALIKVFGNLRMLDYLEGFRYPLSGEFSITTDLARRVRMPGDWGLEVGMLVEVYHNTTVNGICQVDLAESYDHKHQNLSLSDETKGLSRMSIDIIKTFIKKLATQGHSFSREELRSLKATYYRSALDLIDAYRGDAEMNGLKFDSHSEEKAVELFSRNIIKAGEEFYLNPMDTPFIPTWSRVKSAIPNFLTRLKETVNEDNKKYS